jgi:para-nitrobenzyl esterase
MRTIHRMRMLFRGAACTIWMCAAALGQTIDSGMISGTDLGDVRSWLGIPYAAPPVGEMRWRPPEAPRPWTGVRAMDQYGSRCMQPGFGGMFGRGSGPASENCLTLNVWAPKEAKKAPVMVWIHGGAFVEGAGSLAVYNGAELARQGVVVVTINYRLGFFGFFAYPGLSEARGKAAANFGIMDQIAALQWVKRNIAAFGGDPDKVTVFGESAGAESVYILMTSPAARGLFARAIAESGPILRPMRTRQEQEPIDRELSRQWGAGDARALRAVPARQIADSIRPGTLRDCQPVIDGTYIPDEPARLFAQGRQARVPFLLGANSNEASLMALFGVSPQTLMAAVRLDPARLRELFGAEPAAAARALFTDGGFLLPARFLATQMPRVRQPAYLYFFSYVAQRQRRRSQGVMHGGEVPYVFDNGGIFAAFVTPEDRAMAHTVSGYWVQFAKTGDPNGGERAEWPAYTVSNGAWMELGENISVRLHLRSEQLDALQPQFEKRLTIAK